MRKMNGEKPLKEMVNLNQSNSVENSVKCSALVQ